MPEPEGVKQTAPTNMVSVDAEQAKDKALWARMGKMQSETEHQ